LTLLLSRLISSFSTSTSQFFLTNSRFSSSSPFSSDLGFLLVF
jgi:hypothetical protein